MAGPAPVIWSQYEFEQETSPGKVRKALAAIDYLLVRWSMIKDGPSSDTRLEILRKLSRACVAYLAVKEAKKTKKEQSLFGRPSPRLLNRIDKVKQLAQQVFLRLAFERYSYQKGRTKKGQGLPSKLEGSLADLKGSYAHERANFQAIKQDQGLHGTATPINPQGASFVHQRFDPNAPGAAEAAAAAPPAIAALLAKGFNSLTLAEFNTLSAHFAAGGPTLGADQLVHFARKDERLREQMLVPEGGLLYNTRGELAELKWGAYAIDRYGNLFVEKANRSWQEGQRTAQFNHSTLCAGRAVICAGTIKVSKGLITYISNESGHYKPTTQQLINAIYTLSDEYTLPLLESVKEVEEMSAAGPVKHQGMLAFLGAHPELVADR